MQFFGNFGKIISVLADLQSARQEYQHFNAENTRFVLAFPKKTTIFAAEKELVAMRVTVIERGCKSPYSAPADCKSAGTGYFII